MDSKLVSRLNTLRNLPLDKLKLTYLDLIPANLAPPASFWASYNDLKLAIGLHACLAVWEASKNKIVPNEFQIKATIAVMSGQDSLIDAGTGSPLKFSVALFKLTRDATRHSNFCNERI